MKKKTLTTLLIVLIIAGLSLILYPTVSDILRSFAYKRTISAFDSAVESLDDEKYEEMLEAAKDFNRRLVEKSYSLSMLTEKELAEYESLLDVSGNGVMGYITIPKINVSLPIYHGTSDAVLQNGLGHLEGSSLPVGGESTHAIISGHTGLPSGKLFTDIDQLTAGDTFTLRVLRDTLTYEVDQILIVLPHEVDALGIEEGQDYCTLLTCTPYGVNTHRLLVRGHRIPTPVTLDESKSPIEEALGLDDGLIFGIPAEIVLAAAFVLVVLVILTVVLICRRRPKKTGGKYLKKK